MKYLKQIVRPLLLVAGLNWLVYGVSGYDPVQIIFGAVPMIANIVYVLVGLSVLYISLNRYFLCNCKDCVCSSVETKKCDTCNSCSVEAKK